MVAPATPQNFIMNNPTWFPTVPLFFPVDSNFCFRSYFSVQEGDCQSLEIDTSKLIADFHDIEYWEHIATNGVFTIYWNCDTQVILVTDTEVAWESEFISLLEFNKWELDEHIVRFANCFINSLLMTIPDKRQLELVL